MSKKPKLETIFLPTQLYVDLLQVLGRYITYDTKENIEGFIFLDKFFVMDAYKKLIKTSKKKSKK